MAQAGHTSSKGRTVLLVAPLLVAIAFISFVDLSPGHPLVTRTAGVALLMAAWWISGVIPLAATALLPVALFPVLGIMGSGAVAANYVNDIIFLYVGGFLVALAMQRWNLHRRIALGMLSLTGASTGAVLAGFMIPTFFVSMWISNTATTMMMVPIALAVLADLEARGEGGVSDRFSTGLLLSIAYSASIGGMATLIGTPPNLSFARIMQITFPEAPHFTFSQWFAFGFPLALAMALVLWAQLWWMYARRGSGAPLDPRIIREQYRALGPWTAEQVIVLVAFLSVGVLWMTRTGFDLGFLSIPGWAGLFEHPEYFGDGTVAIGVSCVLFLIPSTNEPERRLLDWEVAKGLRWDIVLLYGGGFALASAFVASGLSAWLGDRLGGLQGLHPMLLVFVVCLGISFLTELTSNTATTEMVLPVLAALAVAVGVHPFLLMLPATFACSCAFMLPVATPPNAIIFGAGKVTVAQMARTGFVLNLAAVVLITLATWLLGGWVAGESLTVLPDWAVLRPAGAAAH
jgi:sodium-dependent dicarboxylate transporter 2/3/5